MRSWLPAKNSLPQWRSEQFSTSKAKLIDKKYSIILCYEASERFTQSLKAKLSVVFSLNKTLEYITRTVRFCRNLEESGIEQVRDTLRHLKRNTMLMTNNLQIHPWSRSHLWFLLARWPSLSAGCPDSHSSPGTSAVTAWPQKPYRLLDRTQKHRVYKATLWKQNAIIIVAPNRSLDPFFPCCINRGCITSGWKIQSKQTKQPGCRCTMKEKAKAVRSRNVLELKGGVGKHISHFRQSRATRWHLMHIVIHSHFTQGNKLMCSPRNDPWKTHNLALAQCSFRCYRSEAALLNHKTDPYTPIAAWYAICSWCSLLLHEPILASAGFGF